MRKLLLLIKVKNLSKNLFRVFIYLHSPLLSSFYLWHSHLKFCFIIYIAKHLFVSETARNQNLNFTEIIDFLIWQNILVLASAYLLACLYNLCIHYFYHFGYRIKVVASLKVATEVLRGETQCKYCFTTRCLSYSLINNLASSRN